MALEIGMTRGQPSIKMFLYNLIIPCFAIFQDVNETGLLLDEARCSDLKVQPGSTPASMAAYQNLTPDEMDLLAKMSPDQLVCSDLSAQTIVIIVASSILGLVLVVLIVLSIAFFRWKQNKQCSHHRMGGESFSYSN